MTVNRGPGVRQIGLVGTTPKEHRLALAGQYAENAPGVPRSGLLTQGATNVVTPTAATVPMTYSVAPVAAVIGRTVDEGVYTPTTTGTSTVPTGNSPATGSRWDLIWIKQNDQEKGDADNAAILGVTSGTAAASPTRPTASVPAGALVLAEAQIFAGTTSTTAAPNTVTQLFRITAARGAPIPVRTTVELAEITSPPQGQPVIRLDLPGNPIQRRAGNTWTGGLGAVVTANANQAFPDNATTVVRFASVQMDSGGMVDLGAQATQIKVTAPGKYAVTGGGAFSTGSATGRLVAWARKNGTDIPYGGQSVPIVNNSGTPSEYGAKVALSIDLATNDIIELVMLQKSGFPQVFASNAWSTANLSVVQVG
ncbi:hypothetical protein [Arthrobacter sp. HLT1-20]